VSALWFNSDSAVKWACRELLAGRAISHPDGIAESGGWRLSAIVYVLRHRYQWDIQTIRKGARRVAFYNLRRHPGTLTLPPSAAQLELFRVGDAENTARTADKTDDEATKSREARHGE
jgi:hypothetical protein